RFRRRSRPRLARARSPALLRPVAALRGASATGGLGRIARGAWLLADLRLLLLLHHREVMSHRTLHQAVLADRPDVGRDPVQAHAGRHADDEADEDQRHAGEQELLLAIL